MPPDINTFELQFELLDYDCIFVGLRCVSFSTKVLLLSAYVRGKLVIIWLSVVQFNSILFSIDDRVLDVELMCIYLHFEICVDMYRAACLASIKYLSDKPNYKSLVWWYGFSNCHSTSLHNLCEGVIEFRRRMLLSFLSFYLFPL